MIQDATIEAGVDAGCEGMSNEFDLKGL